MVLSKSHAHAFIFIVFIYLIVILIVMNFTICITRFDYYRVVIQIEKPFITVSFSSF